MNFANHGDFKYNIRSLTTDDVDQYNNLLRYAFQVTEQELVETGWRNDEIKQSKFPVLERADVLGCFDGGILVSQIAVYPLNMNIYGNTYDVGFVTSVCTYPEYSGHGIMKKLMIQSMTNMYKHNQTFAMLFPYSISLYRRFGYEIINNKISYTIKDTQIPTKARAPGYVRRVSYESADFMKLHEAFANQTHGCLHRNSLAWEEYWRWDEDDTNVAVYYRTDNTPSGYIVYLIKEDIMHIKEMIYLDHEAELGLWEFIHAHDSMIDEVRGNTYFSEPVAFELDDGDIKEVIRPYIMGRIIDVEGFLKNYRCDINEDDTVISLDISDDILPWNNRIFNIKFSKGKCYLTEDEASYHLKMSIASLTAILIGYKTASRLYKLDRIIGSNEAVNRLDDLLLHEMPYISDYI